MKKIKSILLAILVIPLIIMAVVVSLPFILLMRIDELIKLRIFRKHEEGNVYLICTSKRNWHEFLNNNVIPVLPDNFRVIWAKPYRDGKQKKIITHLKNSKIYGVAKPYIVVVTPKALLHESLNIKFQHLKTHQKVSEDTREASLKILLQTEKELRTSAYTLSLAPPRSG